MVLRLVRVDENVPVCKAVFPEGTNYVGRGKLLDCEDKRVSRKHGELYVMDECIFIKSLHSKNPCFIKKKNSNDLIVVNFEERFPLNNGDRVGFLPDNYWYEIRISPSLNATQCKMEQSEGSVASVNRMNTEPLDFDDQTQLAGAINPPIENNESTHSETETQHPESSLKRPHEYETPPRKNVKKEPVTPKQTPTKNTPSLNGTASIEPNPSNDETISDTNISKETTDKPTTSKKQGTSNNVILNGSCSSPPRNNNSVRARCKYGVSCYRRNPQHLQEFSHPDDPDWDADRNSAPQRKPGTQMVLRHGNCFYINAHAVHFYDDGFNVESSDGESADFDYEF